MSYIIHNTSLGHISNAEACRSHRWTADLVPFWTVKEDPSKLFLLWALQTLEAGFASTAQNLSENLLHLWRSSHIFGARLDLQLKICPPCHSGATRKPPVLIPPLFKFHSLTVVSMWPLHVTGILDNISPLCSMQLFSLAFLAISINVMVTLFTSA